MRDRYVKKMKWSDIKDIVKSIYAENILLSPYQSFEFLDTVKLGKNDKNPFVTLGYKEDNFVLFDKSSNPIAIAPLYSKKTRNGFVVYIRGHFTSAGHLDFIYSSKFTFEDYCFLMKHIRNYYKKARVCFDRISENSLLYQYALAENTHLMEESVLVTIKLLEDYDCWLSSLSKNVRQNIRTSYNRLNKDGLEFEYKLYKGSSPNEKVRKDIIKLFARRLCEHSKFKSKILEKILYYLKKKNPMTIGIETHPNYIGATLYIENELIAFFEGFVGNNKKILVPRLSINIDYGKYSPGGILINETMKEILEDNQFVEFDLQRGDEPYKYSYGGVEHRNYEWNFSFNEI